MTSATTPAPMLNLTEAEFDERFTVVPTADGEAIRDRMPGVDPKSRHLWTVVTADDGETLCVVPGVHFVNREGYLLTEEEWTDDIADAVYFEAIGSDDEEDF